jgi:hypothetical protein
VFPIDLLGLGSLLDFNLAFLLRGDSECLFEFLWWEFFEPLNDLVFLIFSGAGEDDLFSNALVLFLECELPLAVFGELVLFE